MGIRARSAVTLGLVVGALAATASGAAADVVVGQVPTTAPDFANVHASTDWLQPQVTSTFRPYVVPTGGGVITSWSTYGAKFPCSPACAMTLKIYRPNGSGGYLVVAHDGPRTITYNQLNTFSGLNIPVRAGDVVGLNSGGGDPSGDAPIFTPPDNSSQSYLVSQMNAADGATETFTPNSGPYLLNLAVNLAPPSGGGGNPPPSNVFTIEKLKLNKKKGTAKLPVAVPGAGKLVLSGSTVAGQTKTVTAGTTDLTVKATGKAKTKLDHTGSVTVKLTITFTPTGGTANSKTIKVKLIKKLA